MFKRLMRERRGAALVEYALLVAGVALIATATVAILGHKTNDMMAATAAILPGAHIDDNNPIISGKLIETIDNGTGIQVDVAQIVANSDTERLGENLLGAGQGAVLATLVVEP
jgi:Flp pilus assembly pilin Flp